MSDPCQSVLWPAVIKLHADDELIFVPDAETFTGDTALLRTRFQAQDMLIDSSGIAYTITNSKGLALVHTGLVLALPEVEALLRLHLANSENCCVAKFHALSIREAIVSIFA